MTKRRTRKSDNAPHKGGKVNKMATETRESNYEGYESGRALTRAEIDALVREAERMRSEYLGELLVKFGRLIVKAARRLVGVVRAGFYLVLGQPVSPPRHSH